ncbi:hypothetical protein [Streptomyces arenae]|uniref:hypothetical protein n=1 Tax=Streptomyces arenae TaxID=29301 RepID=UPI00265AD087|nr:hypothetical protein [Streptomyces arenae]MCG7202354.1 hypothetical protein [Streptomyces arenae]
MTGSGMVLSPHPAGWDEALRLALGDLQLDRWRSTKEVLARADSWGQLTSQSQVLASAAAKGRAIEAWCAEEPGDAYALMMLARVLTQRALTAGRAGVDRHSLLGVCTRALEACVSAEAVWPQCPIPGVCRLAVATLDLDPYRPLARTAWAAPPEKLLLPGPWPLLDAVDQLDPCNREAYHRMLQTFTARRSGALNFARYVSDRAPLGSPLRVLPIYGFVEDYALQLRSGRGGAISYWSTELCRYHVTRARDGWFARLKDPRSASLLDLNYLAYGLGVTGLPGAAAVFEAIGPFATPAPWEQAQSAKWWEDSFAAAHRNAMRETRRRR